MWAPGLAPGMTAPGEEIPVSGAAVYVTSTRPAPIPSGVYCEPCQAVPHGAVLTDSRGAFELPGAMPGKKWLVIQKAQFRLEQEIEVTATDIVLTDAQTTMPSEMDPQNGKWIPRVAIAAGSYDHLESIFGKMGIGTVDASGNYTATSGKLDLFDNGGNTLGASAGTLAQLAADPVKLASYHIVFVPCSGDSNIAALRDQNVLKNLRDYVKKGGKLYVTDWSGEWMDNVFPEQIQLGESFGGFGDQIDTPATAYALASDSWNTSQFGTADGDAYDSDDADAVDPGLAAWLGAQSGPSPTGTGPYNAHRFSAVDNWNFIETLHPVQVGTANGQPVMDMPKTWVTGSNGGGLGGGGSRHALTVSFEPAGCGRVLFSTYHTTESTHAGLYPQERILLYLIMEIGTCSDNPVIL